MLLTVQGANAALKFSEVVSACDGTPCRTGGICEAANSLFTCTYVHPTYTLPSSERTYENLGKLYVSDSGIPCPGKVRNIVYRALRTGISNQVFGFTYFDQYPYYSLRDSTEGGHCDAMENAFKIITLSMCSHAAASLLSGDTDPGVSVNQNGLPVGCSFKFDVPQELTLN